MHESRNLILKEMLWIFVAGRVQICITIKSLFMPQEFHGGGASGELHVGAYAFFASRARTKMRTGRCSDKTMEQHECAECYCIVVSQKHAIFNTFFLDFPSIFSPVKYGKLRRANRKCVLLICGWQALKFRAGNIPFLRRF